MSFDSSKAHFLNYCKHFPSGGVMNKACELNIKFADVRCKPGGELPCIISDNCTDRCRSFEMRSETEAEEYAQQAEEGMKQFFERLANNQCPHCGAFVDKRVQVGRCVYAEPCGHRIGQGKA